MSFPVTVASPILMFNASSDLHFADGKIKWFCYLPMAALGQQQSLKSLSPERLESARSSRWKIPDANELGPSPSQLTEAEEDPGDNGENASASHGHARPIYGPFRRIGVVVSNFPTITKCI